MQSETSGFHTLTPSMEHVGVTSNEAPRARDSPRGFYDILKYFWIFEMLRIYFLTKFKSQLQAT